MNHKVKINLNSTQINDEINLKMHEIKLQIKAYQTTKYKKQTNTKLCN